MMAGRGAGKSFAAMWELHTAMMETRNLRARVIAPTLGDGIAAAVDGPNGLLTLSKGQARWLPSAPGGACVRYPNGSRVWIVGTPTEVNVDRLRALTNCIAEGELVTTARGDVPIENVTTDDLVLTRAGWRRVLAAWKKAENREVYEVVTETGERVVGTGDHRVWTENRGWVELRFLKNTDTLQSAGSHSALLGDTSMEPSPTSMSRPVLADAPQFLRAVAVKTVSLLSQTSDVYDLTVEGEHEFFAGGVLVHNCDFDVFEELFANPCAQSAFNQAALSRRRGSRRWLVSSTPRPHQLIKDWEKDPRVEVRRGTSMDNKHIPLDWLHTLETQYLGTRLYRQEVLGEVIEDVEGALWKANDIERSRVTGPASAVASICDRVVVGVDPPTGQGTCGIVVVGQDANGHMYVLDDRSVEEASPHVWAARVKEAADTYDAIVVAEINQGGQMVKEVLNSAGHALPLHTVSATKSKKTRAEPIALLWEVEEQVVHMVTGSTKLIDQMCEWVPGEGASPDRVDALVWACWYLRSRHTAEVRGATVKSGGPVSLPSALSSVRMGRY